MAAFVVSFLVRADAPLPVTVSFTGFTNSISGERLAVFELENLSHITIKRWPIYEVREPSGRSSTERLDQRPFFGRDTQRLF